MNEIRQKKAVVAGASRGIGAAFAVCLARAGYDVALIGRAKSDLGKTAARIIDAGRNAVVCAGDLGKHRDVEEMVSKIEQEFGYVDVLYNGVAGTVDAPLSEVSEAEVEEMVRDTVVGTIWLTKGLLPIVNEGGCILNIITDWAMPNSSGPTTFVAAKYGVLGFGQALAREVVGRRIKVTNVLPGDTASDVDIDEPMTSIERMYGDSKMPLSELIKVLLLAISLKNARIDEIVLTPTDPGYWGG